MTDPARERKLAERLIQRAARARKDPNAFYEHVVREETTRARIKTLPHQKLLFKFALHYPKSVIRMPVGFSKTFTMAALSMFLLGNDPTVRGAVVSAAQGQAQKPLAMVRDYIEDSAELKTVFPELRRSTRTADPWQQSKITVQRPTGIRDPSLSAIGVHGKLPGARLAWLLVDDILSEENTSTPEARAKVVKWFISTVLSRRDLHGSRVCVTNTPWHPEDLTYTLEKAGWPTLTMDVHGNVFFANADDFDCDDIRPSAVDPAAHRLTAHDDPLWDPELAHLPAAERRAARPEGFFDEHDEVPLWPGKFNREAIEQLKKDYSAEPGQFAQLYEMKARSDEDSKVKTEWIDNCKEKARAAGVFSFTSKWSEGRAYTGVDLAIGKKKKNDKTCIFTFGLQPDSHRRILRIDLGRWSGSEIIDRIVEHKNSYNSIICVETNAAQDFLRQWALERDISLPIRAHTTGAEKHSKEHGIESIFIEVENGAWLTPNNPAGEVPKEVQELIDALLFFNPDVHTPDVLMGMWLARLQAQKTGALRRKGGSRQSSGMAAMKNFSVR